MSHTASYLMRAIPLAFAASTTSRPSLDFCCDLSCTNRQQVRQVLYRVTSSQPFSLPDRKHSKTAQSHGTYRGLPLRSSAGTAYGRREVARLVNSQAMQMVRLNRSLSVEANITSRASPRASSSRYRHHAVPFWLGLFAQMRVCSSTSYMQPHRM